MQGFLRRTARLRCPNSLLLLMVLIGLQAVTGCASTPTEANLGPPPARYVEIAREHLRTSLFDPYSARDFQIASPKPGQINLQGALTTKRAGSFAIGAMPRTAWERIPASRKRSY